MGFRFCTLTFCIFLGISFTLFVFSFQFSRLHHLALYTPSLMASRSLVEIGRAHV